MAMANMTIEVTVKTTWVKPVSLFICRYVKKKWVLRLLNPFSIAKVYVNGKLQSAIKFKDILSEVN